MQTKLIKATIVEKGCRSYNHIKILPKYICNGKEKDIRSLAVQSAVLFVYINKTKTGRDKKII